MRLWWLSRTRIDEQMNLGARILALEALNRFLPAKILCACAKFSHPRVVCLSSVNIPVLHHIFLNFAMFFYLSKNLKPGDAVMTDYNSVFAALPFVKKARVILDVRTLPVREGFLGVLERLSFKVGLWVARRAFWGATFITEAMRQEVGRGFKRWAVWGSGVDLNLFDPAKYDRAAERKRWGFEWTVFLYWGALEGRQRGLLEAAKAFREAGLPPDARLVFVGSGALAPKLRELAEVREPVSHREVPSLLAAADFAVIPFRNDVKIRTSFPIKLVEAMAMELPVVSTDVPPLNQFLAEYPLWFRAPSPEELREAFEEAYPHRGQRAKGGRKLTEEYTYEKQVKRLADFLRA